MGLAAAVFGLGCFLATAVRCTSGTFGPGFGVLGKRSAAAEAGRGDRLRLFTPGLPGASCFAGLAAAGLPDDLRFLVNKQKKKRYVKSKKKSVVYLKRCQAPCTVLIMAKKTIRNTERHISTEGCTKDD